MPVGARGVIVFIAGVLVVGEIAQVAELVLHLLVEHVQAAIGVDLHPQVAVFHAVGNEVHGSFDLLRPLAWQSVVDAVAAGRQRIDGHSHTHFLLAVGFQHLHVEVLAAVEDLERRRPPGGIHQMEVLSCLVIQIKVQTDFHGVGARPVCGIVHYEWHTRLRFPVDGPHHGSIAVAREDRTDLLRFPKACHHLTVDGIHTATTDVVVGVVLEQLAPGGPEELVRVRVSQEPGPGAEWFGIALQQGLDSFVGLFEVHARGVHALENDSVPTAVELPLEGRQSLP
ncbi:MAG: hypothetical protein MAG451_02804 [Anaerolineales bacterium]|nr:hypothetical protein [Anaerolineales bacterium]